MTRLKAIDPIDDDYAFRFEYADKSAFHVYADGTAFIVFKDGRREQKFGRVDNRIPLLLGRVAKPRQDRIVALEQALKEIAAMDPKSIRADDLGRAARIARGAFVAVGSSLAAGTEPR